MGYLDPMPNHALSVGGRVAGHVCKTATMRPLMGKALASVRNEWVEAPWFVILTVVVVAFVGPGVVWAAWNALTSLFG